MNLKLKLCTLLCLGFGSLFTPPNIQAELLKTENFEYEAGDLKGNGDWFQAAANTITETIDVVADPLVYTGYQDNAVGNSVLVTPENKTKNQKYAIPFATDPMKDGIVYASFLFKVTTLPAKGEPYIITFAGPNSKPFEEYNSNIMTRGHMFITAGSSSNKFGVKVSRSNAASKSTALDQEFDLGTTYLAVMSYQINSTTGVQEFKFWINPATDGTQPTADFSSTDGQNTTYGIQGVMIHQQKTSSVTPAAVVIDAMRIATSWADLFPNDDPQPTAKLEVTPTAIDFADGLAVLQGESVSKTIVVKGTGLTGDVTLSCPSTAVTIAPSTVTAEEAMAEGGKEVTLTFKAGADMLDATLTLSSEGVADATVALTGAVMPVTDMTSLGALSRVENETYELYRYTGSMAKVSHVNSITKDIYIQDMTGAIRINYELTGMTESPFATGDKVKNMLLVRVDDAAGPCFIPAMALGIEVPVGDITSSGNEVTPSEVTMADIAQDKETYLYRLVTLKDVTLTVTDNTTWSTTGAAASQTINGTTTQGRVRSFHATDLIGEPMPAFLTSVTGISTSKGAVIITARSKADVATAAPELEISSETLIDPNEYQEINKPVEFGTFTVKATALTNPVSIWFGGKNADMFSADRTEIPAGTGIYQVKITYTPTSTGAHEARINFETTPAELNAGASIRAKAYDPANPPVITVDSSELTEFVAGVGETQEQTVKYTVTNGLVYGTIRVDGTGFLISSSSMMKDGTYDLKITFRPQTEGEHSAVITFTTDMAEPVTLPVKGTTSTGPKPEEKEGDELTFGGTALKQYATDFTSAVADNKPISLEGWKNVAVEGTRAWWSATPEEGNQAAKAVAYDSKATESTPLEMMLMSPRLDFKNAEQRLLCFNVMGRMMTENMADNLSIIVIDALAADQDPENLSVLDIDGLGLPCTPDENDQWVRYVLDADAWELPDEFYVAFVFSGTRGKDSSVQYFVDDFSWGRTDMPFIRSSHQLLQMTASAGTVSTSEEITIEGHNLTQPISLSLAGTHAANFTLSTTELPAAGGKFTLDFLSDEVAEHTAIVTLLSGNDARADILVSAANQSGIDAIDAEVSLWGDNVSVYDLNGRLLLSGATTADALKMMKSSRGTLFIVRASDGTAFKYIAK